MDVVDSREVAKLVEKQHKNLLRDINGYIETMRNPTELKIELSGFFIQSTYKDDKIRDDKGETHPALGSGTPPGPSACVATHNAGSVQRPRW